MPALRLASLIAALALFLAAVAGCRAPLRGSGVSVELDITGVPVVGRPAEVGVRLTDAGGAPVTGAGVEVEANMRPAGMALILERAVEDVPGRFVVRGIALTMAGDWVLTARATLPDGRSAEGSIDVPGVSAACGPEAEPSSPPGAGQ